MEHLDKLQRAAASHPHPLLFATVSGAHLYGFPSPDSDFDLRGAHILPIEEVVGLRSPKETVQSMEDREGLEIDLVTHDIDKFFRLLLKRNGYVLEQLLSPLVVQTRPGFEELKALVPRCITRFHANHYLGFFKTEWQLFQKESPKRAKPLLYVYRVLLTGIHLMRTGRIECNLAHLNEEFKLPFIPDLIARKASGGEQSHLQDADLEFHRGHVEALVRTLEEARDSSHLPDAPTAFDELNDLLVRLRLAN